MIDTGSKVDILSTSEENAFNMTIDNIFVKYAMHVRSLKNGLTYLPFKDVDGITMIRDWKGWTKILSINRYDPSPDDKWYELVTEFNESITISSGQLINVYDPNDKQRGFHGEIKYKYELIRADEFVNNSYVRQLGIDLDEPTPYQFALGMCRPITVDQPVKGFTVITQSGHFVVNNIDFSSADFYPNKKDLYK